MTCLIRPWQIEDAPDLARAINNERVQNNLRDGLPFPYTEEDARTFIQAMQRADPNQTFAFAIAADGKVIGSIGAFRKENIHFRTAEMGYYLAEPFWGQGIGTQAVTLITRFLFEHTDIIRIFAEPFAYNIASCRILEKCGFVCEGTLKSNALKNNRIIDMKLYAIIKQ